MEKVTVLDNETKGYPYGGIVGYHASIIFVHLCTRLKQQNKTFTLPHFTYS